MTLKLRRMMHATYEILIIYNAIIGGITQIIQFDIIGALFINR